MKRIKLIVKVKKYVEKGKKYTAFGVCFPDEKGKWECSDEKWEWMKQIFYKRISREEVETADQLELRDIDSFFNSDDDDVYTSWRDTAIANNKEIKKVIERVISTYKKLKPHLNFNWKGEKLYKFEI
jgi:hypothetical protein